MNIIGPDAIVFALEDLTLGAEFLLDVGLKPVETGTSRQRFEALDGTAIILTQTGDPELPKALETGAPLRETIYGVADMASLEAIAKELGKDREVRRGEGGTVHGVDDDGFAISFQKTVRRPLSLAGEAINAPGDLRRPLNTLGADYTSPALPRTLSHVVYYVPDAQRSEAFYVKRLGFTCSDRFTDVGPFLRPAGTNDHHTLFLIQTPPHMKGLEHFTFHFGGPTDVLLAGTRMSAKGYETFWGPGKHIFGSNWFWYFNSPFACHIELDADMDRHDASWKPRAVKLSPDYAQLFLFERREKWAPGSKP